MKCTSIARGAARSKIRPTANKGICSDRVVGDSCVEEGSVAVVVGRVDFRTHVQEEGDIVHWSEGELLTNHKISRRVLDA